MTSSSLVLCHCAAIQGVHLNPFLYMRCISWLTTYCHDILGPNQSNISPWFRFYRPSRGCFLQADTFHDKVTSDAAYYFGAALALTHIKAYRNTCWAMQTHLPTSRTRAPGFRCWLKSSRQKACMCGAEIVALYPVEYQTIGCINSIAWVSAELVSILNPCWLSGYYVLRSIIKHTCTMCALLST